jgi:hypothetical protein
MRADERELMATRLGEIADEIGLELTAERLESVVTLMESTVDGVRATTELGLDESPPGVVPALGYGDES